jgi:hypothetical protein
MGMPSESTFVGVIKVHGIQANCSHFAWDDFCREISPAMKNLQIWEWDERAPDPKNQW